MLVTSLRFPPRFARGGDSSSAVLATRFGSGISAAEKVKPFGQIQRLGMLVTPMMLKTGQIKLTVPSSVDLKVQDITSTCNPGVISDGWGGAYFLIRAISGKDYPKPSKSYQLLGHSSDGLKLTNLRVVPELSPSAQFSHGQEDARITRIDDTYYVVTTGYDGEKTSMCLFTSKDLDAGKFNFEGVIGPKTVMDKDGVLHPERVQGKWLLYHRVIPDMQAIYATTFDEMKQPSFWTQALQPEKLKESVVLQREDDSWQTRLGWGGPPVKTKDGWLHLFHASNVKDSSGIVQDQQKTYCAGALLTDLQDPMKVLHRCPIPVMKPETQEEIVGPVGNVIFPQGFIQKGQEIYFYYGAADDKVGMAKFQLPALLDYLKQFDAEGKTSAA